MNESQSPAGAQVRLSTDFTDALHYAMAAHAEHFRKGGRTVPYLAHLLGTASTVLEAGGSEREAVLALLHDVVEDQPIGGSGHARLADVRARFGARIADEVKALSDWIQEGPGHTKGADKEARKRAYRERLASEPDKSVLLVSAADKLNNARSMEDDRAVHEERMWDRFDGSTREEIIDNYRQLLEIYREAATRDERLRRIVKPLAESIERLRLD